MPFVPTATKLCLKVGFVSVSFRVDLQASPILILKKWNSGLIVEHGLFTEKHKKWRSISETTQTIYCIFWHFIPSVATTL